MDVEIAKAAETAPKPPAPKPCGCCGKRQRLVITNYQSPGDIVMLTAAVRDLHRAYPDSFETDVRTSCPDLWHANPYVKRFPEPWIEEYAAKARDARPAVPIEKDGITFIPAQYPLVNRSNQEPHHFIEGFHHYLEGVLDLVIPVSEFKGDIHLAPEERAWMSQVAEMGVREPFWLIVAGGKWDFTAKWPNPHTLQKVVNRMRDLVFVQVGDAGNWHPRLDGVIDLVGRTDLRQLVRLVYHAVGVITPVSLLMHLAAAVPLPPGRTQRACVVLAGGREPAHWEAYPTHRYLSTQGALPCCAPDACWKSRCTPVGDGDDKDAPDALCPNFTEVPAPPAPLAKKKLDRIRVAKCIDMITADDIVRAIESYYDGGVIERPRPPRTIVPASRPRYWHDLDLSDWRAWKRDGDAYLPFRAYLRKLAETNFVQPQLSGRGIVIPAGGRFLPGAWVTVNLLRRFGCTLPIEIWHLGPDELPEPYRLLMEPLGVSFVDALALRDSHPTHKLGGWQLKPYAITLSRFAEVLLLDADNHPVRDPTYLFDSRLYRETGALFWPDRTRHGPEHSLWRVFGVPYRDEPAHETGQVLIDKRRCWHALQIAMHCNQFSDFYYRHSHGDTQLYRFAFHLLGRPFGVVPHRLLEVPIQRPVEDLERLKLTRYMRQPGDIRAMFLQRDPDGEIIFQHRSGGGGAQAAFTLNENVKIRHFAHHDLCLEFLDELRTQIATYARSVDPAAQLLLDEDKVSPHRRRDLAILLNLLAERRAKILIETGTVRQRENWRNDGGFTWHLGRFAELHEATLYSVDRDDQAVKLARELISPFNGRVILKHDDSIRFLREFDAPIDGLLLDSLDYWPGQERAAQEQALAEVKVALPKLRDQAVIAIDDCRLPNGGKGGLAVPWLREHGWNLVHQGYMSILTRC